MNRRVGTFCAAMLLVLLCLPAAAQNKKTRVLRDTASHTTIVIHDYSPQAYARQKDIAVRSQQAREAELQRAHEIELAKIQADAQVRVARAQQTVVQTPAAPTYVRQEEKKPSYRNGGYFTGFSPFYVGGFGGYGYGGYGYGGYPAYGYRGGYTPGYGGGGYANCRPNYAGCAPAYRGCR